METLHDQMYDAILECLEKKCDHRMVSDDFWRKEAARKITNAVSERLDSLSNWADWTTPFSWDRD